MPSTFCKPYAKHMHYVCMRLLKSSFRKSMFRFIFLALRLFFFSFIWHRHLFCFKASSYVGVYSRARTWISIYTLNICLRDIPKQSTNSRTLTLMHLIELNERTKISPNYISSCLSSFYVHIKINICDIQNDIKKSLFYILFE